MRLEEIVDTYGWQDYYDMVSGVIFKLSEAVRIGSDTSKVVVEQDGVPIGVTTVNRVKELHEHEAL